MARPSDYTEEIGARICSEVAITSDGLEAICGRNKDFPAPATVYRWRNSNEQFREMYARAKEQQAQLLADQILTLADNQQMGVVVTQKPYTFEGGVIKGEDGKPLLLEERKMADMIDHRKLQIEARKWLAMKLLPRIYGEKREVTGPDGGPLQIVSTVPRPPKE